MFKFLINTKINLISIKPDKFLEVLSGLEVIDLNMSGVLRDVRRRRTIAVADDVLFINEDQPDFGRLVDEDEELAALFESSQEVVRNVSAEGDLVVDEFDAFDFLDSANNG